METQILLWCVITPAILSLAFVVGAWAIQRSESNAWSRPLPAVLAVIGWCVAVSACMYARQDLDWSALEAWQIVLVPIGIASLLLAACPCEADSLQATSPRTSFGLWWLIAGLGSVATAMWTMPTGDGWTDMLPLHRPWMATVAAASLINVWSLDRMRRHGASSWSLWVGLAGLVAPTLLAASAYGGLAEWMVSGLVSTFVFAVAAVLMPESTIGKLFPAVLLLAASTTATGRFYTYEDHPTWLYGLILLMPTCVSIPDAWLRERSTMVRVSTAVVVAVLLLAVIGWFLLGDSLFGEPTEEW
ncbi:hypothetical protein RBSH_02906 [Rhodopirellula baltica SH28]|uniref:Transmembrane protein n=1 Tax=Rhodopirellula baltica SH28 TaxID=993517 RepID=K5E7M5_RHOBT|nr:hypothetical protein [Rhodopirellula baltica]EKK01776.1 hypothetical protein RBSH_02906 [Rhodopirellula baltica SH28]